MLQQISCSLTASHRFHINFPDHNRPLYKLPGQLLYACGLRIGEVINLRLTVVQSGRSLLLIRKGKGQKDCTTILSQKLLGNLRVYHKEYKPKAWLFEGAASRAVHDR